MALQISFEFYPPRSVEGLKLLLDTRKVLNALNPSYYSVTFGAGGSTQAKTLETCLALKENGTTPICPHLSCIGTTKAQIKELLDAYKANAINRLVVLRGDLPAGTKIEGDFQFASDLVRWIREQYNHYFHIAIACYPEVHPQSLSAKKDFDFFKQKISAGADEAITQYFYNPDSYLYFIEHCQQEGVQIPIIPGIMPITNYEQLSKFSASCGAEIPRWMRKQLDALSDDPESIFSFGVDVVTHLCDALIQGGAPGLHFYTLNKSQACLEICNRLNLS